MFYFIILWYLPFKLRPVMSGKIKSRNAANADAVSGSVSCGERILKDCHQMYTDTDSGNTSLTSRFLLVLHVIFNTNAFHVCPYISVFYADQNGLITIAQSVGVTLLPPRKKITVMLMGNHSAGKSSFINWYIEEHIQRTGVAIETQGFTFVTSGRKRESLTGNATLHLYPHFKQLQEFKGVSEYVGTEICTSRQKRFSLVTFVDTPGLVDGDMKYPFDVDQAILWLGEVCDLILVFFDPMGQALCKRTLDIVGQLNERQGDRLRFYLSKADEAGGESDRQRVMTQIVQELCKHPGLNKSSLDMTTIYIPQTNKPNQCVNQIDQVCHTIQKTINLTVQNTLNTLEKDCELIREAVTETLNNDWQYSKENRSACSVSCALGLLGFFVMVLFALMVGILYWEMLEMILGTYGTEILLLYLDSIKKGRIENASPPNERLKKECSEGAAGDAESQELLAELSDAERTGLHMEGFYTQQSDTSSLSCFSVDTPSLPRRMPPQDDTASLVSTGTLVPEAIYLPPPGHRLVAHADWDGLQAQVAELQDELTQLREQKAQLEKELDIQTTETQKQVAVLQSQVQTSETLLQELQKSFSQSQSAVQSRLKELSLSQRKVCSELSRLKGGEMEENTAGDDPSEVFSLQGAHTEERLRIEIVNLREQLEMRTEESEVLEVQLSSLKTETDRIQSEKEKLEGELQGCRTELHGLRVALSHLQRDGKTQNHEKTALQNQCLELRSQVISLRSQLDTSQAVQRDFVQLSQSLQ
ncbi:sarcalumenin-like isoform X1, partial [Clarias magur]